ncbi:MAG: VOC family protein [Actinomycetota bacterium]
MSSTHDDRQAGFPTAKMGLTHILVVSDFERSRDWYRGVLGAELFREYGGTSAVFKFGVAARGHRRRTDRGQARRHVRTRPTLDR